MSDKGKEFDRQAEREEDRQEALENAELVVHELRKYVKGRCCVFLVHDVGEAGEFFHGRLMGVMDEVDAYVLRDLTPGEEKLQRTYQIPIDHVKHICHSAGTDKCKECECYKEMSSAGEQP